MSESPPTLSFSFSFSFTQRDYHFRRHVAVVTTSCALASLLGVVMACSGGDNNATMGTNADTTPDANVSIDGGMPSENTPDERMISTTLIRSGVDGVNTYRIPVVIRGIPNAEITVEDPTLVDIAPIPARENLPNTQWVMVTMTQAGATTLTAAADGMSLEAKIIIQSYDPADWAIGQKRYNNPDNPDDTRVPCTDCHGTGPMQVTHDPFFLTLYTDIGLLEVTTAGETTAWQGPSGLTHAWNLTEDEHRGLVPYLRSIEPEIAQSPSFDPLAGNE